MDSKQLLEQIATACGGTYKEWITHAPDPYEPDRKKAQVLTEVNFMLETKDVSIRDRLVEKLHADHFIVDTLEQEVEKVRARILLHIGTAGVAKISADTPKFLL